MIEGVWAFSIKGQKIYKIADIDKRKYAQILDIVKMEHINLVFYKTAHEAVADEQFFEEQLNTTNDVVEIAIFHGRLAWAKLFLFKNDEAIKHV